MEGRGSGGEEVGEEPVEVFKDGVVHGDLAPGVEDVPGVNDDGDRELEGGKGKIEAVANIMSADIPGRRAQAEGPERGKAYRVDADAMFWLAAK